jgi:hypothetical protein
MVNRMHSEQRCNFQGVIWLEPHLQMCAGYLVVELLPDALGSAGGFKIARKAVNK